MPKGDTLQDVVDRAEPYVQVNPTVRPKEFGKSDRGWSRSAAQSEDDAWSQSEAAGVRNKAQLGTPRYPQNTRNFAKGGMVKHGSPKVSDKCSDTKTVKC